MAPIKLEDHIREQLEEREIQPSVDSWNKLNDLLQTKPKKNKNKTWIYLAASIISIALITSLFIKEETVIEPSNTIVDGSEKTEIIKNQKIEITNTENKEPLKEIEKENSIAVETSSIKNSKKNITSSKDIEKPEKVELIQEESIANNNEVFISEDEQIIDSKVTEVVAQIQSLNNSSTPISDEEINNLLLKAQQDLKSNKILNANRVNAQDLLSVVEDELEESFRDRVFEALGDGFKKVRTAVVERNH